jgi:hypothetical protein
VVDSCGEHAEIGVTEVSYETGSTATYFTRHGESVVRTTLGDVPCFEATDVGEGYSIMNLNGDGTFQVAFNGDVATVTCPDETTVDLARAQIEAFFPAIPEECGAAERNNTCTSDALCRQVDPDFICCDRGAHSDCTSRLRCETEPVQTLCTNDDQCGEGLGCCSQETARVCDPGVCGGETCCEVDARQTCEIQAGSCALAQSCIASTLGCVGHAAEILSCINVEDVDVITADYTNGAEAFYYTRLGRPARVTTRNGGQCFRAVYGENGEYEVRDLRTDADYTVAVNGDTVTITCPDQTEETVASAAVLAVLSPIPDPNTCSVYQRDDRCETGQDCVDEGLGEGASCCDGGNSNICVEADDQELGCFLATPKQLCSLNAECGEEAGCCEVEQPRVCDPEICGDEICCYPDAARICDPACLTCNDNDDCDQGTICCGFTNTCELPEDCEGDGTCTTDADCFIGSICCKTGEVNVCLPEGECPIPCRSEDDCTLERACCGSQGDDLGVYCAPRADCVAVQEDCTDNADCGNGEICCRTDDVPSCTAVEACTVACVEDADCGPGKECCGSTTRTPICVDEGTCRKARGESCGDHVECASGLRCCNYHTFGQICIDTEQCGSQIPTTPCMEDPDVCEQYPLAVCCDVNGTPVCTDKSDCTNPQFVCDQHTACSTGGSACCFNRLDPACYSWLEPDACPE